MRQNQCAHYMIVFVYGGNAAVHHAVRRYIQHSVEDAYLYGIDVRRLDYCNGVVELSILMTSEIREEFRLSDYVPAVDSGYEIQSDVYKRQDMRR